MRPSVLLAAIPFALGCAQQSAFRAPSMPTDRPLQVRLHQPAAGVLSYTLSEPGYVAIFSVTRGHGISLLYPYYRSQVDHQSQTGLNQETVHAGSVGWGYTAGGMSPYRALFGYADAYYVIASKYPLPVEGMLGSPYMLRSLIGAEGFRAMNFTEAWDALESILVAGMPDDSWSSDAYLNWRDPFLSLASWQPSQISQCNSWRFFRLSPTAQMDCTINRMPIAGEPVPVPGPAVAEGPRRGRPEKPRDRDPGIPDDPPMATRSSRYTIRNEQPARPVERESSAYREPAPSPAPRVEPRSEPARQYPTQPETKRPEVPNNK